MSGSIRQEKNLLTTTKNTTEKYTPRNEKPQQSKISISRLGFWYKGGDLLLQNSPSLFMQLSRHGQRTYSK